MFTNNTKKQISSKTLKTKTAIFLRLPFSTFLLFVINSKTNQNKYEVVKSIAKSKTGNSLPYFVLFVNSKNVNGRVLRMPKMIGVTFCLLAKWEK